MSDMKACSCQIDPVIRWRYALAAMLVAAVAQQGWAKLKYQTDSYAAQENLVMHLDGICNVGANLPHDPAATSWVNLADANNPAAITANTSSGWRDDGYYFAWNVTPSYAQLATATPAMEQATFEFVFGGDWASQTAKNWGPHFISGSGDQKICMGNAATPLWFKEDAWTGDSVRPQIKDWSWKQASFTLGAAVSDGNNGYDQGVLKTTVARATATDGCIPATAWMIGSRMGQTDVGRQLTGIMKSVRIYNKALTPEQVAANAAVDAARFDGVMPVTNAVVATAMPGINGAEVPGVYAVDGSHTFTAQATVTVDGATLTCDGHAVETWTDGAWGTPVTNATLSCTVTETEKVRITWLWTGASVTTDGDGNLVIDAPAGLAATNTAAVGNVPKVIKTGLGDGFQTAWANGFVGTVDVRDGLLATTHISAFRDAAAYRVAEGATLEFARGCDGNGLQGAFSGAGTVRVSGTGVGTVAGDASAFTGLWQLYAANVNFGTAATPRALNAAAKLDVANNGWFRFFADQTVAGLSGVGVDGGVDIASGKTLTVNAADDALFCGRLAGAGTFAKAGNGTLTLSGGGSSVGGVEVRGGVLSLAGRTVWAREGLRALWRFDDEMEIGADTSAGGGARFEEVYAGGNPPAVELVPGLVGKAVRVQCTGTLVGNYLAYTCAGNAIPTGATPYTFSAWLRPLATSSTGAYIARFCPLGGTGSPGAYSTTGWGNGWYLKFIRENNKQRLTLSYNGWSDTGGADTGRAVGDIPTDDVNDGEWHHVAFTLDANHAMTLYWDGEQIGKNAGLAKYSVNADGNLCPVLQLGSYELKTPHGFNGDFDEVQYLDTVWTAEQVAEEHAARKALLKVASSAIPAPVAHWTFDEIAEEDGVKLFKDSGPNGWDFKNVPTGDAYVERVTGDGINGGAAYLRVQNATLQLKDGVNPGTVITATNPDFTLSVRIRNVLRGDGQTARPVIGFGNVAGAYKCFRLCYEGTPQRAHIIPGSVNENEGWDLTDTYSTPGADAPWQTFTFVNKASEKKVYCYRDGQLIDTLPTSYTLDLSRIDIGYTPWTKQYGYQVDDLQVFTNLLTAAQVQALVCEQAGAAGAPLAHVPVTVAAGGTLAAQPGVQKVGALSGAGTVDLLSGAMFAAADWSCFTGVVTGDGDLFLPKGAKVPLPAAQVATGVAFEDNTIVLDPADATTPFVRTSGTFSLPATGTLRLVGGLQPGNWLGRRFLLAECAAYDGPADTEGWTFDPAASGEVELLGEFRFSNCRLYLQMKGGGTAIVIR